MGLFKNILLGSGAAVVSAAAAQAADLPVKKAAPVEYVRVCDAYGAGFFFIPGTDTCLRISGRLRADYAVVGKGDIYSALGNSTSGSGFIYALNTSTGVVGSTSVAPRPVNGAPVVAIPADAQNITGWEARARIGFDVRTNTAWGVVQAVGQLRMARTTGILQGTGAGEAGSTSAGVTLEAAYVRFAGFTFGAARDNFANMPSVMYMAGGHWASFANGAKQLAYTFTAGGGLSATIAIQDYADTAAGVGILSSTAFNVIDRNFDRTIRYIYDAVPQFNARVDWQQSWGAIGVAAAVARPTFNNLADTYDQSETVWAVGGTLTFQLPMLARGSRIDFTAAYADGMTEYTTNWNSFKSSDARRNVNGFVLLPTSVVFTPTGIETVKSWSVGALFQHFWTPQWRSALAASYGQIDAPTSAKACRWNGVSCFGDADVTYVAAQLAWLPTRDFEIGVELAYARVGQDVRGFTGVGSTEIVRSRSDDNLTGRLRVERNF